MTCGPWYASPDEGVLEFRDCKLELPYYVCHFQQTRLKGAPELSQRMLYSHLELRKARVAVVTGIGVAAFAVGWFLLWHLLRRFTSGNNQAFLPG